MKISDKELQKIIHEELQEAVRRGEITEEELKQLQEGPLKWVKGVGQDLGTAVDAFRKARGDRDMAALNAIADAEEEKAGRKVNFGNVDGRDVYDTKRSGDPGYIAPPTATSKAATPAAAPAAATPAAAPAAATPAAQQKQKSIEIFQQAFTKFANDAYNGKLDVSEMVGKIIARDPNGKLIILAPSDPRAKNVFDNAVKLAKIQTIPTDKRDAIAPDQSKIGKKQMQRDAEEAGVYGESKKPKSYNKLYENWRRYSKG